MGNTQNILLSTAFALLTLSACSGDKSDGHTAPKHDISNGTEPPIVIDGHTLPPDPGEEGKTTLLGIDSNNNGVRDDVEIWIYTTYDKPIERAVFMQNAKAYQVVIAEPEKALENRPILQKASGCESYWRFMAKDQNRSFYLEEYRDYDEEMKPVQFNTAKRFLAYEKYNHNLSGGVYDTLPLDELEAQCDFNTSNF